MVVHLGFSGPHISFQLMLSYQRLLCYVWSILCSRSCFRAILVVRWKACEIAQFMRQTIFCLPCNFSFFFFLFSFLFNYSYSTMRGSWGLRGSWRNGESDVIGQCQKASVRKGHCRPNKWICGSTDWTHHTPAHPFLLPPHYYILLMKASSHGELLWKFTHVHNMAETVSHLLPTIHWSLPLYHSLGKLPLRPGWIPRQRTTLRTLQPSHLFSSTLHLPLALHLQQKILHVIVVTWWAQVSSTSVICLKATEHGSHHLTMRSEVLASQLVRNWIC